MRRARSWTRRACRATTDAKASRSPASVRRIASASCCSPSCGAACGSASGSSTDGPYHPRVEEVSRPPQRRAATLARVDKRPPPRPAVIVHGGAWAIPDAEWKAHRDGVAAAVAAAWTILADNGSALDAVEAAVMLLEDDPTYDAGVGSVLTRDGHVEMDAGVMDGRDLAVGAVAGVRE